MASAVVKMAVVCLLLLSVGQLMPTSVARRPDYHDDAAAAAASLLRLRLELQEEEALALAVAEVEEELARLDDGAGAGAVGACSCDTKCKTCLGKCGLKCIPRGLTGFPVCFINCAFSSDKCFG